jgi:hypothetical protein
MLAKIESRGEIALLEKDIAAIPGAWVGDSDNCPLTHSFSDGIYTREIFIPADVLLVGKIHRHEHPNFLLKGRVTVITEAGGLEELTAPCYMISPAGTKRVVYTHEDTVWVTVHATDCKTPEEAEKFIIAEDYDDDELNENQIKVLEELCLF